MSAPRFGTVFATAVGGSALLFFGIRPLTPPSEIVPQLPLIPVRNDAGNFGFATRAGLISVPHQFEVAQPFDGDRATVSNYSETGIRLDGLIGRDGAWLRPQVAPPEELERQAAWLEGVTKCVSTVASYDPLELETCAARPFTFELADYVPRVTIATGHMNAVFLSAILRLEHVALSRLELILLNGRNVLAIGEIYALGEQPPGDQLYLDQSRDGYFRAAATLTLDDEGRIRGGHAYFDQRAARENSEQDHATSWSAYEQRNIDVRSAFARYDPAETRLSAMLNSLIAARRSVTRKELANLYDDGAWLHVTDYARDLHGAEPVAAFFTEDRRSPVGLAASWLVGPFIIAETVHGQGTKTPTRALEVIEVAGQRVVNHWYFANPLRAEIAGGRAEPPPARPGAEPVRNAKAVVLYEGLPHPLFEREVFATERANSSAVVERHGYPFYRAPLKLEPGDATFLTEVLSDRTTLRWFSGEKKCGGFHPDFTVTWETDEGVYEALTCFGCGEVRWVSPAGKTTRYDIAHWATETLKTVLAKHRVNRPPHSEW